MRLLTVFMLFGNYTPEDDAMHWHLMAQNFLKGHGLVIDERRMAYRPPVPGLYFAAIYAIFGISVRAVQIVNVLLGVFTVWLVYDLVSRIFGVPSARWSALLTSFYPTLLLYTGQLLSETPFIMLIALALWLVWLMRDHTAIWFAPVGIVLGLAVLTRQAGLPIAMLISLWTLCIYPPGGWLRWVSPSLVILAFLALTLTPWTIRNYVVLGKFMPLGSAGGLSLWVANNPLADGTSAGGNRAIPLLETYSEAEKGAAYQRLAVQFIREDPARFAQLALRRLLYFWHLGYHGEGFTEVVFLVVYIPILGLAAIGAWTGWQINRAAVLLFFTVPVSLTIMHMIFLPEGRYRLPAELVVCVLAGIGIGQTIWPIGIGSKTTAQR